MHDIRFIRENPDAFDAAMARRGLELQSGSILETDAKRRALQGQIQDMQSCRNVASKEIGNMAGKAGQDIADDAKADEPAGPTDTDAGNDAAVKKS